MTSPAMPKAIHSCSITRRPSGSVTGVAVVVVGGSVVVVGVVVVVVEDVVVVVVGGAELPAGTRADCAELLHAADTTSAPSNATIRRFTTSEAKAAGASRRSGRA